MKTNATARYSQKPVEAKSDAITAGKSKLQHEVNNGPLQMMQREKQSSILQRKENKTGLPDNLKSGIENLSGMSMDSVKVHYNSSQPAQLNALAYAQGNDIHVASGQEKHLPHEAWHVVQQRQGRVKPTMQMKRGVPVNDDVKLEREADVMGAKAVSLKRREHTKEVKEANQAHVLQRKLNLPVEGAKKEMMEAFYAAIKIAGGALGRMWALAQTDERFTLEFVGSDAPNGYKTAKGATGVWALNSQNAKWESIAEQSVKTLGKYKTSPSVFVRITFKWPDDKVSFGPEDLYTLGHEFSVHAIHAWPKVLEILGQEDVKPEKKTRSLGLDVVDQHEQFRTGQNPYHAIMHNALLEVVGGAKQQQALNQSYSDDLVVQSQDAIIPLMDSMKDAGKIQEEYEKHVEDSKVGKVNIGTLEVFIEKLKARMKDQDKIIEHYMKMDSDLEKRTELLGQAEVHENAKLKLQELCSEMNEASETVFEIIKELDEILLVAKETESDMQFMKDNLVAAKVKFSKHRDSWVVERLVTYIEQAIEQYKRGESKKWCVRVSASLLKDIDQAIKEKADEGPRPYFMDN